MKRFEITPVMLEELKGLYARHVKDVKLAKQAVSESPTEAHIDWVLEAEGRLRDLKEVIAILEVPIGEQLIIQRGF